jgi:hypothetical protein
MTMHRLVPAALAAAAALTTRAADRPPNLPPNPGRASPPPGIEKRAIPVGARAPAVSLPATTGGTWDLAGALRTGPAVLVFYRGDW